MNRTKFVDDLITEIYNTNRKTTGWLKKLDTLTEVLNDYFHMVENELFNEAYNIIPMEMDVKLEEEYVRVKKKKSVTNFNMLTLLTEANIIKGC